MIADVARLLAPETRARGVTLHEGIAGTPVFASAAEDAADMIGAPTEKAVRLARGTVTLAARADGTALRIVLRRRPRHDARGRRPCPRRTP